MEKKVHGAEVLSTKTHNESQEKEKNKQQLKDEVITCRIVFNTRTLYLFYQQHIIIIMHSSSWKR